MMNFFFFVRGCVLIILYTSNITLLHYAILHTRARAQECIYFYDCVYLSKLLFLQKGKVGLCCGCVELCVCLRASVRWCVEL